MQSHVIIMGLHKASHVMCKEPSWASTSSQYVWVPSSYFCPRAIPKGSKTPNSHIIFIYLIPLNHLVCGSRGFFNYLNHTRRPSRVKIHHDITYGVVGSSFGVP